MRQTHAHTGGKVHSGPFRGTAYIRESFKSCYIAKILGIYERELHDAVEWACARKPQLIIDIGAAEGYYAVGLALRNPGARTVAFEMEELGRKYLGDMVRLNHCEKQVEIRGKCEPTDLRGLLADSRGLSLVVCDCEGYETTLLDPAAIPDLKKALILVELHDIFQPAIAELITERFTPTHELERIWSGERKRSDYPFGSLYLRILPKRYSDWALSEWRPGPMSWLWMRPRGG
jgi:hypothetical protein